MMTHEAYKRKVGGLKTLENQQKSKSPRADKSRAWLWAL